MCILYIVYIDVYLSRLGHIRGTHSKFLSVNARVSCILFCSRWCHWCGCCASLKILITCLTAAHEKIVSDGNEYKYLVQCLYSAETYPEPCQASKLKLFVMLLTIFTKISILDVWHGSEHPSNHHSQNIGQWEKEV